MISTGWRVAAECGSAVPVIPLTDSIREIDGNESHPLSRANFRLVQTPQIFSFATLNRAYDQLNSSDIPLHLTDDASVIESAGGCVTFYEGEPTNIKVTHPMDFAIAEAMFSAMKPDDVPQ